VRAGLRRGARAWLRLHRAMLGALRTRGRRRAGVARLLGCAGLDVALAVVAVFIVAMLVGPLLNI
jgi:hypothetical protein